MIDLRSDTVTKPTGAMREAMARAEVGDDWYGEDPTVIRLQETVAARLGKEAALFVPSGTMANQVALRVHCRHGDDVLVGEEAHIQWHENGAAGALAGVQLTAVGHGGLFTAAEAEAACKPDNGLYPPTRLLCVEDTHNRGGGKCWPASELAAVCAAGRRLGLALHLDGARLWNAEIRSGVPARERCAGFDTVSVCLSKGLGAPVGSLLCGGREQIRRARRYRQMYGGGMRQSGVLAAAGLYALEHHFERLREDHDNARLLAGMLGASPLVRVLGEAESAQRSGAPSSESAQRSGAPFTESAQRSGAPFIETNIIVFDLLPPAPEAGAFAAALRQRGVLVNAFGQRRLRAVTHLDVDRVRCEQAAALMLEVLQEMAR